MSLLWCREVDREVAANRGSGTGRSVQGKSENVNNAASNG